MRIQLKHDPIPPRAKVGDKVYYISPHNCYGVRSAVVVEMRLVSRHYEQVMSNGDVILKDSRSICDHTTFLSRDDAVRHIIAGLVEHINCCKASVATFQHQLSESERVLATLQHQFPDLEPTKPCFFGDLFAFTMP